MKRRRFIAALALLPAAVACASRAGEPQKVAPMKFKVEHTDEEWKKLLSPESYDVLRHKGTERAFTGPLVNEHRKGTFKCAGCATPLFSSDAKFESGTGWPSFWQPIDAKAVLEIEDKTYGMVRTEVECATCGGHLGHVFDDGPRPTGLRYCMNSAAMTFDPAKA
jgi:peptide-methionine (R)-S-oxide reductase